MLANKTNQIKRTLLTALTIILFQHVHAQIIVKNAVIYSPYGTDAVYKINKGTGKLESVLSLKENVVWSTANEEKGKLFVCGNNYAYMIDVASFKIEKQVMYFPMLEKEEHHEDNPNLIQKNPRISNTGKVVYAWNEEYQNILKEIYNNRKERESLDEEDYQNRTSSFKEEIKLSEKKMKELPYNMWYTYDLFRDTSWLTYRSFWGGQVYVVDDFLYVLEEEIVPWVEGIFDQYEYPDKRVNYLTAIDLNTTNKNSIKVDLNTLSPSVRAEFRRPWFHENLFDQLMIDVKDGAHSAIYDKPTAAIEILTDKLHVELINIKEYSSTIDRVKDLGIEFKVNHLVVNIEHTPPPLHEYEAVPAVPERKDYKRQKQWMEAHDHWFEVLVPEYNNRVKPKVEKYNNWVANLDKNKIVITDATSSEMVKEITNVHFYKPVDAKHILVVRSYEFELFDVANLKSIWTCDLDF